MEGELWSILYAWVVAEATLRPRRKRVRYGDWVILLVVLWAALHDRPLSWACRAQNWGGADALPWESLPSPATVSRRARQLSFWLLYSGERAGERGSRGAGSSSTPFSIRCVVGPPRRIFRPQEEFRLPRSDNALAYEEEEA